MKANHEVVSICTLLLAALAEPLLRLLVLLCSFTFLQDDISIPCKHTAESMDQVVSQCIVPLAALHGHHVSADAACPALQFTFLQDDIGIPLNYRHMEGFGVHTFTLINKEGKITYVKFHWKPTCGVKNLLEEEAITVGGSNHSHATKVSAISYHDGSKLHQRK